MARGLPSRGSSLWSESWRRIRKDPVAVLCMAVIVAYALVAILCAMGLIAAGESDEVRVMRGAWVDGAWVLKETKATEYSPPSPWTRIRVAWALPKAGPSDAARREVRDFLGLGPLPTAADLAAEEAAARGTTILGAEVEPPRPRRIPPGDYTKPGEDGLYPDERAAMPGWWDYPLGTDFLARDVFKRVIHGTRIAMSVGLVSCLIAIPIGTFFGALAGYYGGLIDELIVLMYMTIASVPGLLLLLAFVLVVGKGIIGVYVALGLTSWVSLCRLIRGEFIKHKEREYVLAARAVGASDMSCIFKHILPNVTHVLIISLSLRFVYAVQSEVILSYLGVGVQGQPSWGIMINDAKLELARGVWWQLAGATGAMLLIVLALNIFGDILRDALDPKLRV